MKQKLIFVNILILISLLLSACSSSTITIKVPEVHSPIVFATPVPAGGNSSVHPYQVNPNDPILWYGLYGLAGAALLFSLIALLRKPKQ